MGTIIARGSGVDLTGIQAALEQLQFLLVNLIIATNNDQVVDNDGNLIFGS